MSIFEQLEKCPYGHELWPGKAQVSWMPCICELARKASRHGRGMGHVTVLCNACHKQVRESKFFEPAHDRDQRPVSG